MAKLGKNITFPIYKGDGTSFHDLVLHKSTYDSVVMSLSDKITGEVYYKDNNLDVSMNEYINVKRNPDDAQETPVQYVLVNPPTIVREGVVSENGQLNGITKYSFVFYHPMYKLGNLPFTDIAVSLNEKRFLSESREFNWIGTAIDYVAKMNKNLEGTEFVVRISENLYDQGVPSAKLTTLSNVLTFNDTMMDEALKIFYETYAIPYVVDQLPSTDSAYASGKRFLILVGLPYETIDDGQGNEFVFRFGQGVGLKNNSRTPRNNKIVTRVAGYGSEENIPYGYPQIRWFGPSDWTNTKNDPTDPTSYPIYEGIVGGALVKLIKHPFTRTHLMPTVYVETLFNKVSPYNTDGTINTDYDPNTTLVDYYDATAEDDYPNPINRDAPSYESHEFADIKPQLGHETAITGATPLNDDLTPATDWDDSLDDNGEYKQSYFKISLPQLSFDLYACAAITQEMNIVMRGGACLGCTFPVQIDWDEYKKNFYRADGTFDPVPHTTEGDLHVRDITKFPNSSQGAIDVIVKKENSTFGTLMPNVYQKPMAGDEIVFTGISLPQSYIDLAQALLDDAMKQWMLENNVHYWDYPLKFDEQFLSNNTDILLQLRPNVAVTFVFADTELTLYVKQLTIKYGEKVLPQYDITLTDNIEASRNSIGQAQADITKIDSGLSRINSVVEDITRNERIKATGSDMRPVYINGNNVPQEVKGIDVPENIRTEKNVEAMGGVAARGMATLQRGGGGGMGTVTGISVNGTLYEPSQGLITLPDYPSLDGYATQNYVAQYFYDNFTQSNIKSTLGIYDWALAAYKPSYNFSEIGSKPTTLAGYGITDAHITSGVITLGGNTITPATLTNGKIPLSQIPDAILGQLIYGGTVNGSGVVTLSQNAKDKWGITSLTLTSTNYSTYEGAFFIASADATSGVPSTLGLLVGDWVVATASGWGKIDNTDAVTGVKGDAESSYRIGNVNITKGNIGLGNVENTALSTWAGTANITTLGTIATGVWHGTAIGYDYLASGVQTSLGKADTVRGYFDTNGLLNKANHYTPASDSSADYSASASGATADWSIDVVKGVQIQRDAKGHILGVAVTSGKIPAKPTYAFSDLTSHPTTLSGYGITDGVNGLQKSGSGYLSGVDFVEGNPHSLYFTFTSFAKAQIGYTGGSGTTTYKMRVKADGAWSDYLALQQAGASAWGIVTDQAQTFGGDKTFNGNIQSMKGVAARGMATLQRSGGGGSGTVTSIKFGSASVIAADNGLLSVPVGQGTSNGQINIGGQDVAVKGLAALAYLPSLSFGDLTTHPTTLGGYGITDAKIDNGVITLGSNSITPLTGITSSMVTTALGYTPFNNANFTKANIKSTLGISDWALASSKPSYAFSEITGSVANNQLANSSVSIAGTSVSLGGSISAATLKSNLGLGASAYVDYDTEVTQNSAKLITSGAVYNAIDNLPEPMIMKGTLGTNGTITSLPTASASNEGFTYKVITAGTYASQAAKVGDVFVSCKPVGASAYEWILIPAGDTDSDTWRNIKVNGTQLLGTAISSGAVNFKNGGNITLTGSGNDITLGVASGYAIPTTAKQSNWDTAYGWGNHANAGYALASNLGTASTHAHSDYVTAISWDSTNNKLAWSKGGTAQTAITIGYATNADTVDGYHASAFGYQKGGSNYDCNEVGTHFAAYRFNSSPLNAFPNAAWSNMLVIGAGSDTMTQIGGSYGSQELYFRSGTWYSDGTGSIRNATWKRIVHSGNISSFNAGSATTISRLFSKKSEEETASGYYKIATITHSNWAFCSFTMLVCNSYSGIKCNTLFDFRCSDNSTTLNNYAFNIIGGTDLSSRLAYLETKNGDNTTKIELFMLCSRYEHPEFFLIAQHASSIMVLNTTDWGATPDKADGTTMTGSAVNTIVASALTSTSIGSAAQPVYFDANGKPVACTYSLNKTVPSDALFTDANVKQEAVSSSVYTNWRTIPFGASNSGTETFDATTVTGQLYSVNTLKFQPSSGTLRTMVFKSVASQGTAPLVVASTTRVANLNADLLDGYEASALVKYDGGAAEQTIKSSISSISKGVINLWRNSGDHYTFLGFSNGTTETYLGGIGFKAQNDHNLYRKDGGNYYKIWDENNDGAGSGLNADLLDGQHGSYYATASDVTTLQGYFTNGVANNALKLNTEVSFSVGSSGNNKYRKISTITLSGRYKSEFGVMEYHSTIVTNNGYASFGLLYFYAYQQNPLGQTSMVTFEQLGDTKKYQFYAVETASSENTIIDIYVKIDSLYTGIGLVKVSGTLTLEDGGSWLDELPTGTRTIEPSFTGRIGLADTASKLSNTSAIGSTTKPVYFTANGVPSACSTYAGGTAVTLNGSSKAASTASFYAPTGAGTSGQILKSTAGAPEWINQSALVAGKATQLETSRTLWGQSFNGTSDIGTDKPAKMPYVLFRTITSGSDATIGYVGRDGSSNTINLKSYTGYPVAIGAGQQDDIYITTDHKVGIGVTSPSEKLHVNGNIIANGGVAARGMATLQGGAGTGNPVIQVNIGNTPYTPTNGIVSLPAYPTWSTLSGKPSNVSAFTNDSGYISGDALAVTFSSTTLTSSSTSLYLNNTVQRDTLQKVTISSASYGGQTFSIKLTGSGSYYGYHRQVLVINNSGKNINLSLTDANYIYIGTYEWLTSGGWQHNDSNPIPMDSNNGMFLLDIIQASSSEYPVVKVTRMNFWAD